MQAPTISWQFQALVSQVPGETGPPIAISSCQPPIPSAVIAWVTLDGTYNVDIWAQNLFNAVYNTCQNNPAGLLYAIYYDDADCTCSVGFTFITENCICEPCRDYMSNCTACTSRTVCTACDSGYTVNSSARCQLCTVTLVGCLTCSSTTICTTCDAANNYLKSGSVCICATGYLMVSGVCNACSGYMTNCVACTGQTVCTACSVGFTVNSTQNC